MKMKSTACWLAILWLLACSACLGQDVAGSGDSSDGAAESLTASEQPSPEPIPPADITSQATEVAGRLREIEATIEPSPVVAKLALDFSKQAQSIADLRLELNQLSASQATPRQLDEQRREWNRLRSDIAAWMQLADERWRTLQETRDETGRLLEKWRLTREADLAGELPEELIRRVDQIIAQIESLQGAFRPRSDQVAEFIERLAQSQVTIDEAMGQLSELTENVNRQLFTRDAPALWQTQDAAWLALDNTTRDSAARWIRETRIFAAAHHYRLLLHVLIFLALVVAAHIAWRSSRHWPEEQHELDQAKFLLSRPVSVALVFAILVGYFLYGPLPAAVRDCFYLLLLVPILILARGLTESHERRGMYGLLIIAGIFQVVQIVPPASLLFRTALLVIELASAAVVGCAIHDFRSAIDSKVRWHVRAVIAVLAVVFIAFLFAFSANLLGWVNLALYLTEGTLLTCKGALLALLIGRAGAALIPVFLHHGPAQSLLSVRRHTDLYARSGVVLLSLLLLFIWSQQTLRRFRLSETFADQVQAVFSTPFSWVDMEITFGNLVKAMLILAATIVGQRVLSFLLNEELFPRFRMRTSSAVIYATLLKYVIVGVGIGMAFSALGFTATQFTVLLGALGVGIGFGLQNIVNNFVSGLILLFERPIKIGDIVEMGPNWGKIKRIGIRATSVETFEGAEIVVPNGDLVAKEVKNWTRSDSTARVEVLVGTAYDSDPHKVLQILLDSAKNNEFVHAEPEPFAMMFGFGDSALNFRLLCWTSIDKRGIVTSEVHIAVHQALADAGIEIPFPQRDLHLRTNGDALLEFNKMARAE